MGMRNGPGICPDVNLLGMSKPSGNVLGMIMVVSIGARHESGVNIMSISLVGIHGNMTIGVGMSTLVAGMNASNGNADTIGEHRAPVINGMVRVRMSGLGVLAMVGSPTGCHEHNGIIMSNTSWDVATNTIGMSWTVCDGKGATNTGLGGTASV